MTPTVWRIGEYAVTLAVGLQQSGQQVSVLSTTWAPRDNQYMRRLLANGVTYVQVPKWLSRPASHWPTKERILKAILWLASPLIFLLATGSLLLKHNRWRQAWTSAHGWLRGQIHYFIAPNRYQPLTRLLLSWWRLHWRPDMLHIQGYTSTLLFVIEWAHKRKIPSCTRSIRLPMPGSIGGRVLSKASIKLHWWLPSLKRAPRDCARSAA